MTQKNWIKEGKYRIKGGKGGQKGKHITDIYITETDTTELENLSHNIEIKNNKARHKIQIVNTARWP